MPDPLRLLVVDDSRLFRSALEEAIGGTRDVQVVGSVFSGAKAMEFIRANPPDLVTLDVEMPGMNGLETLRQIQAFNEARPTDPPVGAIMVSAFTRRGAQVTVDALSAGAFDFITKPAASNPEENILILRDQLLTKIRLFAGTRRRHQPATTSVQPPTVVTPVRRPDIQRSAIRAVVIGASTGGPRALSEMLPELTSLVRIPILIVQHMPPDFTRSLAETLARQCGRPAVEATDGLPLKDGLICVAPGGKHLLIRGIASSSITGLNDQPPENGCRPSADVLFRSAASVLGSEVVGVILTGMGRDGTAGLGAIQRSGGHVIAQDETSSVVWGMPGSAVEAGVTDEVLPLNRIARGVAAMVSRKTP